MTNPAIVVSTENDPTPLVKIFANKFTKALSQPDFARKVSKFNGSFAMASTKDPQSITIDVADGAIKICRGIQPRAKIEIRMDFDKPVNPRVIGLFRHPLFALQASRLLDFPAISWTDAVHQFWTAHQDYPGMPLGIRIACTDESREISLGDEQQMTITGKANDLAEVFAGDSVFAQSCILGKFKVEASFEHLVVLSDLTLQIMLGDR